MTLPADDPWCETDRIEAAGRRWDARIRWLHSEDIPLLVAPESSAHRRAEPWSHEYEQMMRALSGATREAGARVALNGHGGDFLFYVSPVFMADLLARGRLLRLWREWHAMPVRKARAFFEYAVQPLLPGIALRAAARLRGGRRLHGYVESAIPFWFDKSFMQSSGIADRAAAASPRAPRGVSHAQYEAYWTLTRPHFDRVVSTTAEFCLEDGVESRLPLMDRRLIDFAMNRPWWERRSGGEKKRLIRHAMRDLLPAEVLAPRPFKTGSLGGYFGKALHRGLPELLPLAEMPLLAEFGVINQAGFRRAVDAYRRGAARDNRLGVQLLATLQAELWLRARVGRIDSAQALGGVRETAARAAG